MPMEKTGGLEKIVTVALIRKLAGERYYERGLRKRLLSGSSAGRKKMTRSKEKWCGRRPSDSILVD
jgi:hypothetical protein